MSALISVVVPFYNSEEYLNECLDSLMYQTDTEFELVLINDGSKDQSLKIAEEYSGFFSSFTLITTNNQGALLARLKGISIAVGEYILFVDADDCIKKDTISLLKEKIKNTRADVVCFDYVEGSAVDFSKHSKTQSVFGDSTIFYKDKSLQYIRQIICRGTGDGNSLCNKLIKRELLCSINPSKNLLGLCQGDDLFVMLTVANKMNTFLYSPEVLYFYRDNPCSVSTSFNPHHLDDLTIVFNKLVEYSRKWGDECMHNAYQCIMHNVVWQMTNLAKSDADRLTRKEQSKRIREFMLAFSRCFPDTVKTGMRLDFKIPLFFLDKKLYSMSLEVTNLISSIYSLYRGK